MEGQLNVRSLNQEILPGEARDPHLMAAGLGKVDKPGNRVFLEQLQIDHVVAQAVLQKLAENAPAQTFVVKDQSVEVGLEGKNTGAQDGEIEVALRGVEEMNVQEGVEDVVVVEIGDVCRVDILLVVEYAVQVELEVRGHEDVRVVPQLDAVENVLVEEIIVRVKLRARKNFAEIKVAARLINIGVQRVDLDKPVARHRIIRLQRVLVIRVEGVEGVFGMARQVKGAPAPLHSLDRHDLVRRLGVGSGSRRCSRRSSDRSGSRWCWSWRGLLVRRRGCLRDGRRIARNCRGYARRAGIR